MTDAVRTWVEDNRDEMVQPWLREALLAVLDLHERATTVSGDPGSVCAHCEYGYPCATVRAIADALRVSDGI
jgi:hypothetical protein